jgi:hypothetical protein
METEAQVIEHKSVELDRSIWEPGLEVVRQEAARFFALAEKPGLTVQELNEPVTHVVALMNSTLKRWFGGHPALVHLNNGTEFRDWRRAVMDWVKAAKSQRELTGFEAAIWEIRDLTEKVSWIYLNCP